MILQVIDVSAQFLWFALLLWHFQILCEIHAYFPKLLACILATHSLQDFRAARVLGDEVRHVIDDSVDDYVLAIAGILSVFRHVVGGEYFRHG